MRGCCEHIRPRNAKSNFKANAIALQRSFTRLNSMGDTNFPICPDHDTLMVEYNFEPWEAILPQGTLEAFRSPNLECSIVDLTGAAECLYAPEPRGPQPSSY